ncbi:hypothetical protein [Christiangramia forsetii]|uniref:Membrane or secreted protein n=2 Tax=Christiangramia forsetii TaxID=411153 RepID=A0M1A9_CHRFK|nr:hypothetical protein [Christiangramia forsetii]GGG42970.1 hypothetical protein GCM10011532_28610 [Christiangramia forsetii]CAL66404.1 membrane or secreted protein [Christiangramia forsetii KT0803]
MRFSFYLALLGLCFLFFSCSGVKVTNQQKINTGFKPQKILVVGASLDNEIRKYFEEKLSEALEEKGFSALSSYRFFDKEFVMGQRTDKKEKEFMQWMQTHGFDAVILSEITGSSTKLTWLRSMEIMSDNIAGINDPNSDNKLFEGDTSPPDIVIYNIRTSLYCICPNKDDKLIWQMDAEMRKPKKITKGINKYIEKQLSNFE